MVSRSSPISLSFTRSGDKLIMLNVCSFRYVIDSIYLFVYWCYWCSNDLFEMPMEKSYIYVHCSFTSLQFHSLPLSFSLSHLHIDGILCCYCFFKIVIRYLIGAIVCCIYAMTWINMFYVFTFYSICFQLSLWVAISMTINSNSCFFFLLSRIQPRQTILRNNKKIRFDWRLWAFLFFWKLGSSCSKFCRMIFYAEFPQRPSNIDKRSLLADSDCKVELIHLKIADRSVYYFFYAHGWFARHTEKHSINSHLQFYNSPFRWNEKLCQRWDKQ